MSIGFFKETAATAVRPDDLLVKVVQTLMSNAAAAERLKVNAIYPAALQQASEKTVAIQNALEGNVAAPTSPQAAG